MELPRFNPISGAGEMLQVNLGIAQGYQSLFQRAEAIRQSKEGFEMEKQRFATNQAMAAVNVKAAENSLRRQNRQMEIEDYSRDVEKKKIDAEAAQARADLDKQTAVEELLSQAETDFSNLEKLDPRDIREFRAAKLALQAKYGKLSDDPRFLKIAGGRLANFAALEENALGVVNTDATEALFEIQMAQATGADITKFAKDRRVIRAISSGVPIGQQLAQTMHQIATERAKAAVDLKKVQAAGQSAVDAAKAKAGAGKPIPSELFTSTEKLQGSYQALKDIKATYDNSPELRGPFIGLVRNLNPWDTDAQVLASKVTAAIPGLARGVFGEVGVLTNQDMETYRSLLPNNRSPEKAAKVLFDFLSKKLEDSYSKRIKALKGQGYRTDGFDEQLGEDPTVTADDILSAAGVGR